MGVGLFRSEFLFMNRGGSLPGEEEQFEAYRDAVVALQGLPVTIRMSTWARTSRSNAARPTIATTMG